MIDPITDAWLELLRVLLVEKCPGWDCACHDPPAIPVKVRIVQVGPPGAAA